MIISCPSCETHFSVPDSALGLRGRTLRCARCGHKWHQDPVEPMDDVPLEMPPAGGTTAANRGDSFADRDFEADDGFALHPGGDHLSFGSTLDGLSGDNPAEAEEDPFAKIAELMMSSTPEPIPGVFASPPPKRTPRRKGAAGLWLLLVVLLVSSIGAGLYFFQDRVIDAVPEAARFYEQLGVRNDVVGAGLMFQAYNSERMVQDQTEVLIVQGVIANTTDQPREIPLLRLALYNDDKMLQKKIISPPQTTLDARGRVGFRITLEQPNPDASRFEVTFTPAKGPGE